MWHDGAEPGAVPGAAISGFWRPSRVGPGLENGASVPTAVEPLNWRLRPLQSVHTRLLVQAAVVISSTALPGSLISSSSGWLPITKFADVPAELKKRHRSTSPLAAPSATGMKVKVHVPFMLWPAATLISTYTSLSPVAVRVTPFST